MKFQSLPYRPTHIPKGSILVYFDREQYTNSDIQDTMNALDPEFTFIDLKIHNVHFYKLLEQPQTVDDDLMEAEVEWLNRPGSYEEDETFITFINEIKNRLLIVPSEADLNLINFKTILKLLAAIAGITLVLSLMGSK